MTFSQELKEEVVSIKTNNQKLGNVIITAILKALGVFIYEGNNISIEVKSSSAKLAKNFFKVIKELYPQINLQVRVQSQQTFKRKANAYIVKLEGDVKKLLYDLKLIDNINTQMIFNLNPIIFKADQDQEVATYVRYFFIASGTVNDPRKKKQYHLEIISQNEIYLKEIQSLLNDYEINMKMSKRKNNFPLYLNKSEEIADFLKLIGATNMLFEFEDFRITRDFHSANNRINNAEIANEVKRQKATEKQIQAIHYLYEVGELNNFQIKTQEVAKIRLKFPEDTLNELKDRFDQNLSKSNLSHHLNLIIKKAELIGSKKK